MKGMVRCRGTGSRRGHCRSRVHRAEGSFRTEFARWPRRSFLEVLRWHVRVGDRRCSSHVSTPVIDGQVGVVVDKVPVAGCHHVCGFESLPASRVGQLGREIGGEETRRQSMKSDDGLISVYAQSVRSTLALREMKPTHVAPLPDHRRIQPGTPVTDWCLPLLLPQVPYGVFQEGREIARVDSVENREKDRRVGRGIVEFFV